MTTSLSSKGGGAAEILLWHLLSVWNMSIQHWISVNTFTVVKDLEQTRLFWIEYVHPTYQMDVKHWNSTFWQKIFWNIEH